MDIDAIKQRIALAKEAVADLPDPLKTEAFGVILSKLLEDLQEVSKGKTVATLLTNLSNEAPTISGASTCREAIAKLFASEWGRKPRALREIIDSMRLNAVYYSDTVVATELNRMTRLGLLRRLKEGTGYKYVSAKPISA